MEKRDEILYHIFKDGTEENSLTEPSYSITSKRYGVMNFSNKDLLLEYMKDKFPQDAIQKVKEWDDTFEERKTGESYIDGDNEFIIVSTI